MRKREHRIAAAVALALALAGCEQLSSNASAPPAPAAPAVVLDDQLVGQIKRGETKMDQVRGLITAKPIINYQAGHEIWVYQGVAEPGSTTPRTVTVQFDDRGVVHNIGKMDLPR